MVTIRKWPRESAVDYADLFASENSRLIAESLKRMAEVSHCHSGSGYDRAMAILSDHLAQDGAILSTRQNQVVEEVRDWLRDLFTVRG